MRVLVLGGTEFTGPFVVRDLVAAGHEVAVPPRRARASADARRVDMRAFRREALRRTIEVRGDGTPLFSQDGTGFLNVFEGAGGETSHNLFSHCCGYGESLAVDSHGLAQIAFWSNATGHTGYLYGKLGPTGDLAGGLRTLSTGETVERAACCPGSPSRRRRRLCASSTTAFPSRRRPCGRAARR